MEKVIVKIEIGGFKVITPYNAHFVTRARDIGGKWDGEAWIIPKIMEAPLKETLLDIYGQDGFTKTELLNVSIDLDKAGDFYHEQSIEMFGLTLARRAYRDGSVKLGDGVYVIKGTFPSRGGSSKNPSLSLNQGSGMILQVQKVPKTKVEEAMLEYPEAITVIEENNDEPTLEELLLKEKNLLMELKDIQKKIKKLSIKK